MSITFKQKESQKSNLNCPLVAKANSSNFAALKKLPQKVPNQTKKKHSSACLP
jgi:hypothetical protein